jgi:hypothetical protein
MIIIHFIREEAYEALGWIKESKSPYAFATSRFDETKNANEFVEHLYKLGAKEIHVRID